MIQFFRIFFLTFILQFFFYSSAFTSTTSSEFKIWLNDYKKIALKEGISENTINLVFKDIKFIEKVIVYDRKQPEFYEDTITYVSKRANNSRKNQAEKLYKKNKDLLNQIEKEFNVEKEILLALWGIETNFGKHVGKMHILSSLATLSFDKRRSEFFSKQLIIILKLIDKKIIDHKKLYGSWAGAYGNFQFMPSTIKSYAIDFDENNKIELKESVEDSFASAANYINKIGWIMGEPCFYRIRMNKKINKLPLNAIKKRNASG